MLADWQSSAHGPALSQQENLRAQAIVSSGRREQFLAGRWLAKTLLCEALGGTPVDWRISADADAKPRVLDTSVQISIAHSGDYVACALADAAVGIDVERVNTKRSITGIAEWVCNADEQLALRALQGDLAMLEFNRLWTRKEARLKQYGLPFGIAALRAIQTAQTDGNTAMGGTWCFAQQGLVLSLAADGLPNLRVRWPAQWHADTVQWHRYA
ncbi:MAG: 4'-phosphopantetheinyl transferase superfamily protein [Pseudomonadota bacterium]